MKKGQKLICLKESRNFLGQLLFEKGKQYEVLYVDNESHHIKVCINHTLYANEYNTFPLEWVKKNFKEV